MSYSEIAQIVGCTPKAVETRIYRARQLLKSRLAGDETARSFDKDPIS